MDRKKRILMGAILVVAMIHIPQMALTPGIARMSTDAFPEFSLLSVQSAVTLPCLLSVLSGVVGAYLIRFGKLSKRAAVLIGLAFHGSAGLFVILLHGEFWQIVAAGLLLGSGTGLVVPNITSIMIDDFGEHERKLASGLQGSFVSLGGIIQSFFAGLLVTVVWFGGYIMLLLAWPILLFCLFGLPKSNITPPINRRSNKIRAGDGGRFRDLPKDVFLFSFFASLLFVMTFAALGNNLSSHLQASGFENYSSLAGTGIAVNLAAGVIMGFFFNKLSRRFGDYLIAAAFFLMAAGYAIVAVCGRSVPLMLIGVFVVGMSLTIASPQGIVSISRYVTPNNSFFATLLFNCIMNGLAGFLAAPVYTGISQFISGDSTVGRYIFIAACSLAIGLVFLLITALRAKRGVSWR